MFNFLRGTAAALGMHAFSLSPQAMLALNALQHASYKKRGFYGPGRKEHKRLTDGTPSKTKVRVTRPAAARRVPVGEQGRVPGTARAEAGNAKHGRGCSMSDVNETLKERGATHGEYNDHADITQRLKDVIRSGRTYDSCKPHERETLDMIAHKIGRIVSGNPHFTDHWHDIAGYATLSERRNEPAPLEDFTPPATIDTKVAMFNLYLERGLTAATAASKAGVVLTGGNGVVGYTVRGKSETA